MTTITGNFEGLIVAKEGTGKRGAWKLYNILVDGKKYSIGFDPVAIATGSRVSFESETNEKGYEEANPKSIKVIAPSGAGAPAAATSGGVSDSTSGSDPRQRSIETQACIKAAAPIVAAMIQSGAQVDSPSATVAGLVRDFLRILHPAPKAAPKPVVFEPAEADPFDGDNIF